MIPPRLSNPATSPTSAIASHGRRARQDRRRPLLVAIEHGDREPAEGHRQRRHRHDVAEHRAGLNEVERRRREDDRREDPCPLVDEAGDERVRREHAGHAPERERRAAGPLMEAEDPKADRHRVERELGAAEIVQVGERVVRAVESQALRAEDVQRQAPGQVGHVELERVPEAALGERGEEEEEGDREEGGDAERGPAPPAGRRLRRPRRAARGLVERPRAPRRRPRDRRVDGGACGGVVALRRSRLRARNGGSLGFGSSGMGGTLGSCGRDRPSNAFGRPGH